MEKSRVSIAVISSILLVSFLASLIPLRASGAATVSVRIVDFAFTPQNITVVIGVNNTVNWTNFGPDFAHTTTSDTGVWDSGISSVRILGVGQSFNFTFKQVGTFSYHCALHPFMKGTVVVLSQGGTNTTATSAPMTSSTTSSTSTTLPPTTTASSATTTQPVQSTASSTLETTTTTLPVASGGNFSVVYLGGAILALAAVVTIFLWRRRRTTTR